MLDTQKAHCPYCGELIELVIDTSQEQQEYIEDCSVCCRPISVTISVSQAMAEVSLILRGEDE